MFEALTVKFISTLFNNFTSLIYRAFRITFRTGSHSSGQFMKRIMIRSLPLPLPLALSYFFPSLIFLPSRSSIPLSWEVPQDFPCNTVWVWDSSAMNVVGYCCSIQWFWIFQIWSAHSLSVLPVQVIPSLYCWPSQWCRSVQEWKKCAPIDCILSKCRRIVNKILLVLALKNCIEGATHKVEWLIHE